MGGLKVSSRSQGMTKKHHRPHFINIFPLKLKGIRNISSGESALFLNNLLEPYGSWNSSEFYTQKTHQMYLMNDAFYASFPSFHSVSPFTQGKNIIEGEKFIL